MFKHLFNKKPTELAKDFKSSGSQTQSYDIEVLAKEALITLAGDLSYDNVAAVKDILKNIIKVSQSPDNACLACGCNCSNCGCQVIDGCVDSCCAKCGCCIDHTLPF